MPHVDARVKAPVIPERLLPEDTRPNEAVGKCDIMALSQESEATDDLFTVLNGEIRPLESLIDTDRGRDELYVDEDAGDDHDDGQGDSESGSDLDDLASTLENI